MLPHRRARLVAGRGRLRAFGARRWRRRRPHALGRARRPHPRGHARVLGVIGVVAGACSHRDSRLSAPAWPRSCRCSSWPRLRRHGDRLERRATRRSRAALAAGRGRCDRPARPASSLRGRRRRARRCSRCIAAARPAATGRAFAMCASSAADRDGRPAASRDVETHSISGKVDSTRSLGAPDGAHLRGQRFATMHAGSRRRSPPRSSMAPHGRDP